MPPQFYNSSSPKPLGTRKDLYKRGGRVKLKKGSDEKWIQKATADIKKRGTQGVCTGEKFGSKSCPPGSKRYNLAKTFKKMAKSR